MFPWESGRDATQDNTPNVAHREDVIQLMSAEEFVSSLTYVLLGTFSRVNRI
jgi:hypothetical protein